MAERVDHVERAGAVGLVVRRPADLGAAVGDDPLVDGVDVGDLEVHRERGAAERRRRRRTPISGYSSDSMNAGPADGQLGVADAAVVAGVADLLDGAEHVDVPVDGRRPPGRRRGTA